MAAETFSLLKDANNIPVCAYQPGADALNQILWAAVQVVDDTVITDANGYFQATNKPILDADGDKFITAFDVNPRREDTGVALYVGTAAGEVNSNTGKFRLFTDAALTTPAASLSIKCTYWTVKQVKVDANGRLSVDINSSALPVGAATAAKQDTIISYIDTLEALITATNGYVDGIESLLTAIKDTAGVKKIVDTVAADVTDRAARELGKVTTERVGNKGELLINLTTPVVVPPGQSYTTNFVSVKGFSRLSAAAQRTAGSGNVWDLDIRAKLRSDALEMTVISSSSSDASYKFVSDDIALEEAAIRISNDGASDITVNDLLLYARL